MHRFLLLFVIGCWGGGDAESAMRHSWDSRFGGKQIDWRGTSIHILGLSCQSPCLKVRTQRCDSAFAFVLEHSLITNSLSTWASSRSFHIWVLFFTIGFVGFLNCRYGFLWFFFFFFGGLLCFYFAFLLDFSRFWKIFPVGWWGE